MNSRQKALREQARDILSIRTRLRQAQNDYANSIRDYVMTCATDEDVSELIHDLVEVVRP